MGLIIEVVLWRLCFTRAGERLSDNVVIYKTLSWKRTVRQAKYQISLEMFCFLSTFITYIQCVLFSYSGCGVTGWLFVMSILLQKSFDSIFKTFYYNWFCRKCFCFVDFEKHFAYLQRLSVPLLTEEEGKSLHAIIWRGNDN